MFQTSRRTTWRIPTLYNIPMDKAAIEVLFDQTSCKEQRQKGEACSRCIVYKLYIPKIS